VWDAYAGQLLDDALESLRRQEVSLRVVVVDNASVVAVNASPDVEVVRTEGRLPLGSARNLGIQRVETPFVVVWDADDLMMPGTIRTLQEAMAHDRRLVAAGAAILDDVEGPRHRWPRRWAARLLGTPRLFAFVSSVWSMYPAAGATIMRVEAVREGGGYSDAESGDDWVLGVSLALRGRLGWTERPGRVYRQHPGSVWARHATRAHLRAHARAVRARLRSDPATPRWLRALLPVVSVAQHAAIAASRAVRLKPRRAEP
jgi:Glycosyl transferase family 2